MALAPRDIFPLKRQASLWAGLQGQYGGRALKLIFYAVPGSSRTPSTEGRTYNPLRSLAGRIILLVFSATVVSAPMVTWISAQSLDGFLREKVDQRSYSFVEPLDALSIAAKRLSDGEREVEISHRDVESAIDRAASVRV